MDSFAQRDAPKASGWDRCGICEVELVPIDRGRETEHDDADQAEQRAGEAERGRSGDEQNAEDCCALLAVHM
jgi:ribosomal protein L34E